MRRKKPKASIDKKDILDDKEKIDENIDDDMENEDMPEQEDIELEGPDDESLEDIDEDDFSDVLDIMGLDNTSDVLSKLRNDDDHGEESQNFDEVIRYSNKSVTKKPPKRTSKKSKAKTKVREKVIKEDFSDDFSDDSENTHRGKWLITTCIYCADMYRFRSDGEKPSTCGKPECNAKHEERMKRIKGRDVAA